MLIALAVFVGVVVIIYGAYSLFVVRDENKLLDRLRPSGPKRTAMRGVLKPEEQVSSVGPLRAALEKSQYAGPLRQLVEQSGLSLNAGTLVLMCGCAGVATYLIVAFLSHLMLLGLGAGVIATYIPIWIVQRARTKRMLKFEEHFPEAIDLIARALRAGHALPTGLGMVADELPAPVGTEFRMLYDEQNFGLTLPDAMRNFARRIPVLDARFFVTAVLTQREAGGNLAEVLDNLSSVIRERFKVKRQVRVISAHGRITGWILACLPPSLALVLSVINPAFIRILTHDPIGQKMIIAAVVLQTIGTLIIRKIVNIEY
jgi:tight adherence protein B